MVNHPNRSRLGDLNTLETVKSYLARMVANSDPDLTLADIIEQEIDDDERILAFEVEPRTIIKYSTDSGEYERSDQPAKEHDFVHMRAVVAVIDLGAYGVIRQPVAYFDAKAGSPVSMAARLNKELG